MKCKVFHHLHNAIYSRVQKLTIHQLFMH